MSSPEDYDYLQSLAEYVAWMRAQGPRPEDPPAPPNIPADEWASRMRIGLCIGLRVRGDIVVGEYPDGMTEEEKRQADDCEDAMRESVSHPQSPDPPIGEPCYYEPTDGEEAPETTSRPTLARRTPLTKADWGRLKMMTPDDYDYEDVVLRRGEYRDWLRGVGPCPKWPRRPQRLAADEWEFRRLLSLYFGMRLRGELKPGEYLEGMDAEDGQLVDVHIKASGETAETEEIENLFVLECGVRATLHAYVSWLGKPEPTLEEVGCRFNQISQPRVVRAARG